MILPEIVALTPFAPERVQQALRQRSVRRMQPTPDVAAADAPHPDRAA